MTELDLPMLLHLLRSGDMDAAIEAGLMRLPPAALTAVDMETHAVLIQARQRLTTAWAARERFRARQARLQRRERERQARRAVVAPVCVPADAGSAQVPAVRPVLPAAAMAALVRARSRALPKST